MAASIFAIKVLLTFFKKITPSGLLLLCKKSQI